MATDLSTLSASRADIANLQSQINSIENYDNTLATKISVTSLSGNLQSQINSINSYNNTLATKISVTSLSSNLQTEIVTLSGNLQTEINVLSADYTSELFTRSTQVSGLSSKLNLDESYIRNIQLQTTLNEVNIKTLFNDVLQLKNILTNLLIILKNVGNMDIAGINYNLNQTLLSVQNLVSITYAAGVATNNNSFSLSVYPLSTYPLSTYHNISLLTEVRPYSYTNNLSLSAANQLNWYWKNQKNYNTVIENALALSGTYTII